MSDVQKRIVDWHGDRFPDKTIWHVLSKLTEEVGELNQAVIGIDEGRSGRGDPVVEATQSALVLFTIAGRYLNVDLLDLVAAEVARIERLRMPWQDKP